jgi:hypothetical protein
MVFSVSARLGLLRVMNADNLPRRSLSFCKRNQTNTAFRSLQKNEAPAK